MPSETIFADSMLQTSWAQRSRRSWTTLTSFGLQAVIIGLLLLLPLWKTVGLPSIRKITTPISAGYAEPAPVVRPVSGRNVVMPVTSAHPIVLPRAHTFGPISQTNDDPEPLPPGGCPGCVSGDGPVGTASGPPISIFSGNHSVGTPPPAPRPVVREFKTSSMLEGRLIRRVQPVYPVLAKTAHIQGSVVLFAVISRSGTIDSLRVVSGHPLLVAAAVDAVKQWQYRPYILNQEPIEVETQITVNFILGN